MDTSIAPQDYINLTGTLSSPKKYLCTNGISCCTESTQPPISNRCAVLVDAGLHAAPAVRAGAGRQADRGEGDHHLGQHEVSCDWSAGRSTHL